MPPLDECTTDPRTERVVPIRGLVIAGRKHAADSERLSRSLDTPFAHPKIRDEAVLLKEAALLLGLACECVGADERTQGATLVRLGEGERVEIVNAGERVEIVKEGEALVRLGPGETIAGAGDVVLRVAGMGRWRRVLAAVRGVW